MSNRPAPTTAADRQFSRLLNIATARGADVALCLPPTRYPEIQASSIVDVDGLEFRVDVITHVRNQRHGGWNRCAPYFKIHPYKMDRADIPEAREIIDSAFGRQSGEF